LAARAGALSPLPQPHGGKALGGWRVGKEEGVGVLGDHENSSL
jgi:hypothetical protein